MTDAVRTEYRLNREQRSVKMPWAGKTGLAKAAVILSVTLLLSLGLCGVNLAAFSRYGQIGGGARPPGTSLWPTNLLVLAGLAELGGILIGSVGLVLIGLIALAKVIFSKREGESNH
jgi:hypothetical protein